MNEYLTSIGLTQSDIHLITFALRRLSEETAFSTTKDDAENLIEYIELENTGKPNHYKVRLLDGHLAKPDQIVNGYLGNAFGNGEPMTYTRGEAIKKARGFKGKIEKL